MSRIQLIFKDYQEKNKVIVAEVENLEDKNNKLLSDLKSADIRIKELSKKLPSFNSKDYGKPFKQIFLDYDKDFYKNWYILWFMRGW